MIPAIARSSCHFHRARAPDQCPEPNTQCIADQLAGVVFGLAAVRLRAPALERRLAVVPAFAAGRFAFGFDAVFALAAGAFRVAPVFRGAARLATGLDVAVTAVPPSSSAHLPESTRCAASATASAIKEPSLEALVIIAVAA